MARRRTDINRASAFIEQRWGQYSTPDLSKLCLDPNYPPEQLAKDLDELADVLHRRADIVDAEDKIMLKIGCGLSNISIGSLLIVPSFRHGFEPFFVTHTKVGRPFGFVWDARNRHFKHEFVYCPAISSAIHLMQDEKLLDWLKTHLHGQMLESKRVPADFDAIVLLRQFKTWTAFRMWVIQTYGNIVVDKETDTLMRSYKPKINLGETL